MHARVVYTWGRKGVLFREVSSVYIIERFHCTRSVYSEFTEVDLSCSCWRVWLCVPVWYRMRPGSIYYWMLLLQLRHIGSASLPRRLTT